MMLLEGSVWGAVLCVEKKGGPRRFVGASVKEVVGGVVWGVVLALGQRSLCDLGWDLCTAVTRGTIVLR